MTFNGSLGRYERILHIMGRHVSFIKCENNEKFRVEKDTLNTTVTRYDSLVFVSKSLINYKDKVMNGKYRKGG